MMMDDDERRELQAAGFRVGTVAEFLELTDEESRMVERRAAASRVGPKLSHPYGPWWILLLAAIGLGKLGGDVVRLIIELFSAISSA